MSFLSKNTIKMKTSFSCCDYYCLKELHPRNLTLNKKNVNKTVISTLTGKCELNLHSLKIVESFI